MKANRASPLATIVLAATLLAIVAGCSNRRETAPAPTPSPVARPLPAAPRPTPPPRTAEWRDMPQSPGTWRWRMEGSRSVARFGLDEAASELVLSCNRDAALVTLIRPGKAEGAVPITVLAASGNRTLTGEAQAGPPPVIALAIPARDGVLDAMAFSRGRFAVEVAEQPTLYLPSWPEVSRVIEDCR